MTCSYNKKACTRLLSKSEKSALKITAPSYAIRVLCNEMALRLLLLIWLSGFYTQAWAGDFSVSPLCRPMAADMIIDRVWGGTRVGFGTLDNTDFIYLGYYDGDRWLTVSQINKCNGIIQKVRLPSRFAGWDSHNSVALALDGAGRLHVAGNMHASPLVYARMDEPDNLRSLSVLKPLLGIEEERTTYPNFFRFPDGSLGFSYRSGQSGNGSEIVNRFDGTKWSRWIDQPLFAPSTVKQHVNAYHTGFVTGSDGFFHIAWVWRENANVETNFNVSYARSHDLKTWESSTGAFIALPITPSNAEVVDNVPKGSGLFNNIRLGFDTQGRAVISYLKFDTQGFSQLFHAKREADDWKIVQSTDWTYRWDPRGGGTIPSEISFSGLMARQSHLMERVRHPEIGSVTLKYTPSTLRVDSIIKNYDRGATATVKREMVPGAVLNAQALRQADGGTSHAHSISWLSHPSDNRDRPRECKTTGLDCAFVSELHLHTSRPPVSEGAER